jgi:hypothetical protein
MEAMTRRRQAVNRRLGDAGNMDCSKKWVRKKSVALFVSLLTYDWLRENSFSFVCDKVKENYYWFHLDVFDGRDEAMCSMDLEKIVLPATLSS